MKRTISVFIASPGDLAEERRRFRDVIEELNGGFGDGAGVEFEALGWEDTLASTGRRSQGVINQEIDRCDVFVLTLYRRWGQEAPDSPYSSYTEEEFHRAMDRFKKDGTPEIFIFFKRVEAESEADPGPQLKQVMDFRLHLEDTRQVLYHYFDDGEGFSEEVNKHLRAYAKGELPKPDRDREIVVLPMESLKEVENAKKEAARKAEEANKANDKAEQAQLEIEEMQLQMAEDATQLSMEGKVEYARQKFAELVTKTSNLQILYLAYSFYNRIGDLDAAIEAIDKWLSICGPDQLTVNTSAAYGNLGLVYETRGEILRAVELYQKSLKIDESLGNKEGMANAYGNLGNVFQKLGKLDFAEDMQRKSLEINESIGKIEKMAILYCNIGILYQTRGEFENAEKMYYEALRIDESLGDKEGMACAYGNLGNLYYFREDLDRAEEMFLKAINISKLISHKEILANQYANLGKVYAKRGDLESSIEFYHKSIKLFQEIQSPNAEKVNKWLIEVQKQIVEQNNEKS